MDAAARWSATQVVALYVFRYSLSLVSDSWLVVDLPVCVLVGAAPTNLRDNDRLLTRRSAWSALSVSDFCQRIERALATARLSV